MYAESPFKTQPYTYSTLNVVADSSGRMTNVLIDPDRIQVSIGKIAWDELEGSSRFAE
jgi:hypothetical protein